MGENCGGGELWLCDVDSDSDEAIFVDGRDVRWAKRTTRGEIGLKLVTRELVREFVPRSNWTNGSDLAE